VTASQETHSVRTHLRLEINSYDETIRKFIPGYEAGLTKAAAAVAEAAPSLVLDLGAGTGALSAEVLKHNNVGHLCAIDLDVEMLERAKARLLEFGKRVSFRQANFLDPFPECDGVTASLALHHVPSLEEKRTHAFKHFTEWAEEDTDFPLDSELTAMLEAGFDAHCVWKEIPNCVLVGVASARKLHEAK